MAIKLPTLKKNNKFFWAFIVVGALFIILSIFLMPVWNGIDWAVWKSWGTQAINLIIALFLSLYLFGWLLKKMLRTSGSTLKVLTIIEFVLLLLVDLYLILGQWIPQLRIVPVNGACATAGLAIWIRGCVEIFRAYFHQRDSKSYYPIWWLVVALAFVSVGMWMMVAPFITDLTLLWIFVCLLIVVGLLAIGYGIYAKPQKKAHVRENKEEKSSTKKTNKK